MSREAAFHFPFIFFWNVSKDVETSAFYYKTLKILLYCNSVELWNFNWLCKQQYNEKQPKVDFYNFSWLIAFMVFPFELSLRLLVRKSWHYFSHFWRIFKGTINFKTACVRLILTRWLLKGFQKQDLLCVSVTTSFGVNNFRNTYTMRFNSFLKCSKFDLNSKNAKRWQKVFGFLDD